jgi:sec-independent protein translocase protein TatA
MLAPIPVGTDPQITLSKLGDVGRAIYRKGAESAELMPRSTGKILRSLDRATLALIVTECYNGRRRAYRTARRGLTEMLNFQGPELLLILLLVLIIFGAGKLPQVFSSLGKGVREFREASEGKDETPAPPPANPPATTTTPASPTSAAPEAPSSKQES